MEAPLPPIERQDSSKYWDAAGWDPDDRVYVGAEEGMDLHRMAELPSDGGKSLTRPGDKMSLTDSLSSRKPQSAQESPQEGRQQGPPPALDASPQAENSRTPKSGFSRKDSAAYWLADSWDPEERVYAGGDAVGMHRLAVQPEQHNSAAGASSASAKPQAAEPRRPETPVSAPAGVPPAPSPPAPASAPQAEAQSPHRRQSDQSLGSEKGGLARKDSAAYWLADAWDPEERVYVGGDATGAHRIAVQPDQGGPANVSPTALAAEANTRSSLDSSSGLVPGPSSSEPGPRKSGFSRHQSANYWNSEAWDPEERIYVGGEAAGNHRIAVQSPTTGAASKAKPAPLPPALESPGAANLPRGMLSPMSEEDYRKQSKASAASVAEQEGVAFCPRLLTEVVDNACTALHRRSEAGNVVDYLEKEQWISTVDDLRELVDEEWKELRLPVRLKTKLRQQLAMQAQPSTPSASSRGQTPSAQRLLKPSRLNDGSRYFTSVRWAVDETTAAGQAGGPGSLQRVKSSDTSALSHVWMGGLTSRALGLGESAGPQVDLASSLGYRPSLEELYDVSMGIGSGGFGIVRNGVHRDSGVECAVKAVSKVVAGAPYALTLVGGLGKSLLTMSQDKFHENVVRYLDVLEGPSYFYIVMEELHGPELLQQMEEAFPAPTWYIKYILRQVLKALDHIHNVVGLFHRDVKLSNFRFKGPNVVSAKSRKPESFDGTAPLVLLDFGCAGRLDKEWDGLVCGTLMFMAPELLSSQVRRCYLAALDIWSAGVIMYVLLTGEKPFEDNEVKKLSTARPLEEGQPDGEASQRDQEVGAILRRALSLRPLQEFCIEAKALLSSMLILSPRDRVKAQEALQHVWLARNDDDENSVELPVPGSKYRMVRSISKQSERMTPSAASAGSPSPTSDDLDRLFDISQPDGNLERILSEGWEQLKPQPR